MRSSSLRILLRLSALDGQLHEVELAESRARRQSAVLSQRKEFLEELIAEERRRIAGSPAESATTGESEAPAASDRLIALEAERSAFTDALQRLDRQVAGQTASLETGQLVTERAAVISELPADIAAEYETLRRAGRHPAVVLMESGFCTGCHLRVPARLAADARGALAIVRCPHCQRILLDPTGQELHGG